MSFSATLYIVAEPNCLRGTGMQDVDVLQDEAQVKHRESRMGI
jgi:hypothetical protein